MLTIEESKSLIHFTFFFTNITMVTKRQIVRIVFYVSIIIMLHAINGGVEAWNRLVNSPELCEKELGVQLIAFIFKLFEVFLHYFIFGMIIALIVVPVSTLAFMIYSFVCVYLNIETKISLATFFKLLISSCLIVYAIGLIYMSLR